MSTITLNSITSGYNVNKINDNFNTILGSVNTDLVHVAGGQNTMGQDLDLNSHSLLNVGTMDANTIQLNGVTVMPQELVLTNAVLKADLASTATGEGAALVGFLQSGTGAIARTLASKDSEKVSLLDFIDSSYHAAIRGYTSTFDATAAITAAYAYAKTIRGTVECPSGLFNISGTITLDGTANFIGAGAGGANLDVENPVNRSVTLFKWVGAAGGTCFAQTGRVGGVIIGNFAIDCAGIANIGMTMDRLQYSTVKPLSIYNQLVDGLICQPNPTAANDNLMLNVFERLVLRGKNRCLYFADAVGGAHTSNVCHNKFLHITANCLGAAVNNAIVLGDSDNNNFGFIYTAVFNYPTDYGLVFNNYARSNYFYHFQGVVHALSSSKNAIFGFDRENGQPQPTVDAGASLFWTEFGNNATNWNMTVPLKNMQTYIVGNLSQSGLAPDPSRFSLVRSATNTLTGMGYTAAGEFQLYHTPDGTNIGTPIRLNYNHIGFLGATPIVKQTVTGSKGANAALASLITVLASFGLITDSTT